MDFKRIALAMPGQSSHGLEKWYLTNESRLQLNEAWRRKVDAMTARHMPTRDLHPVPLDAPPMGSLHAWTASGPHPGHGQPYDQSNGGPSSRPDYPMAIPYKPASYNATAPEPGFNPMGPYNPQPSSSVHTSYQHAAYGGVPPVNTAPGATIATAAATTMPYGYTYPQQPYFASSYAAPYATTLPYSAAAATATANQASVAATVSAANAAASSVSRRSGSRSERKRSSRSSSVARGAGMGTETLYGPPGM